MELAYKGVLELRRTIRKDLEVQVIDVGLEGTFIEM